VQEMTDFDISAKVWLCADKNDRCIKTRRADLWHPLLGHVVERRWRHNAEAEDENVGVRVTERSQQIKVILPPTLAITYFNLTNTTDKVTSH